MSLAGIGLAVHGVTGGITGILLWIMSSISPWHLQAWEQDLSLQGCSVVIESAKVVFQWCCGELECIWCGMPQVWTPLLHQLELWLSKLQLLQLLSWVPQRQEMLWPLTHTWICFKRCEVFWCFGAMLTGFYRRVGVEVEEPNWRGKGGYLPYPKFFHFCPVGQCNVYPGRLEQSVLYLNLIL